MTGILREKKLNRNFLIEYGRLRAGFRSLNSDSLIEEIVRYINDGFDITNLENLKKAPWAQLLLIKLILIDPCYRKKTEPKASRVNTLLNKVWLSM